MLGSTSKPSDATSNEKSGNADLLPPDVKPTADRGVYLVHSGSRVSVWHRVDVEQFQCDCESATIGWHRRAQKKHGLSWDTLCKHLKTALAAHGAVVALAFRITDDGP